MTTQMPTDLLESVEAARPVLNPEPSPPPGEPSGSDAWSIGLLVTADLLAACVSLPLALLLLSRASSSPANSLRNFGVNITADASFPWQLFSPWRWRASTGRIAGLPRGQLFRDEGDLHHALWWLRPCDRSQLGTAPCTQDRRKRFDPTAVSRHSHRCRHHVRSGNHGAFRRGVHSKVLIVGSGALVDRVVTYLGITKGVQYLGRVGDTLETEEGSLGTLSDLPELCAQLQANRIIIAYPTSVSHESITTLRSLPRSVHISVIPRYFELVSWRSRIADLRGLPLIDVAPTSLTRWIASSSEGSTWSRACCSSSFSSRSRA